MANNLSPKHICFLELPAILAGSRQWHCNQQALHRMHPVIEAAFKLQDPADYAQLCLEWPYVSDKDKTRIAFTQDDRAGDADRQTLTTVGKYLTRHFPTLPDHTIRDLVAKYATVSVFSISMIAEDIVDAVQDGPPSCMQWDEDRVDEVGCHPYEVYSPTFGWGIAVRKDGRQINARALVMKRMKGDTEIKYFVRTYQRPSDTCTRYSAPDEQLAQWLEGQGYEHRQSWRGEKISYIESKLRSYDFVAPYIDGGAQYVSEGYGSCDGMASGKYLAICDNGDYECTSQNGGYEEQNRCTCDDCGDRMNEDDSYGIGEDGDHRVGSCCIDNYTHVHGRRGYEYYVHEDDAIECDNEWYDRNYMGDNGIVELHDGEYANMDDAVCIESSGDWYRTDDDEIVLDHAGDYQLRDDCVELENGDWALSDDAWCCESSGEHYLCDDVTPVIIHDMTFHPDASAEDIAEAIRIRTGQTNLFVTPVTPAERAAVMAPIVVTPETVTTAYVQSDKVLMVDKYSHKLINVPRSNLEFCVLSAEWVTVTPDLYVKFVRMGWHGAFYDVPCESVTRNEAEGWTIYEPVPPVLTQEGYSSWLWADRVSITSPNGSLHWVTPHVANIYAELFKFTVHAHIAATETI